MQDNNEYDPRKAPMLLKISKALIERRGDDFVDAVIDYIITEKVYISESAVKKFVLAVKLSVI